VPSLGPFKPYLPTRYWDEWRNLFTGDTTLDMYRGVGSALAFTLIFTGIALLRFRRKDILS
jgi:ABC-type transport system involved in multi-copper enzyme maturation permease subunit